MKFWFNDIFILVFGLFVLRQALVNHRLKQPGYQKVVQNQVLAGGFAVLFGAGVLLAVAHGAALDSEDARAVASCGRADG